MSKIKICGLFREEDIQAVNKASADYAGFIIDFPKSHRNVTPERAAELRAGLKQNMKAVGVFVDQPVEKLIRLAEEGVIDVIQLHGREEETYISHLKSIVTIPVIQAFQIKECADIDRAERSSADMILLDSGQGTGTCFAWKNPKIRNRLMQIERRWFFAGGVTPYNIEEIRKELHPYGIDISSGVESNKVKDGRKIEEAVLAAHKEEQE